MGELIVYALGKRIYIRGATGNERPSVLNEREELLRYWATLLIQIKKGSCLLLRWLLFQRGKLKKMQEKEVPHQGKEKKKDQRILQGEGISPIEDEPGFLVFEYLFVFAQKHGKRIRMLRQPRGHSSCRGSGRC